MAGYSQNNYKTECSHKKVDQSINCSPNQYFEDKENCNPNITEFYISNQHNYKKITELEEEDLNDEVKHYAYPQIYKTITISESSGSDRDQIQNSDIKRIPNFDHNKFGKKSKNSTTNSCSQTEEIIRNKSNLPNLDGKYEKFQEFVTESIDNLEKY